MTSQELRRKYIDFFIKKGHVEIPSASLIPENDPSTLFVSAGMQPLVPFLLGEKHPAGKRLVNSQKCIRTGDIDEVGDKTYLTFFEMLGHWSLGDYFKKEAIEMSYEFLTQELGLKKENLAFSVFEGDETAPFDQESFDKWIELGIPKNRIAKLDRDNNWWEQKNAVTGPCGPDTEMFYWIGLDPAPETFDPEDSNWVEIGNDVLMQYEKVGQNKYKPASQKNIDNGTGFERLLCVVNNLDDVFKTDLFEGLIKKIEELSGLNYINPSVSRSARATSPSKGEDIKCSMRIIADHIRSATFIMGDDSGIAPSNVDQGYVVRKLIRRAIRHGKLLNINDVFCFKISEVVIKIMSDVYPELKKNKDFIINQMVEEEEKFRKTLEQGLREFNKLNSVDGKSAFNLYQTYGFPFEMTKELAKEKNLEVDEKGFNKEFEKHQEKSRTAAAGKFKGGLADHSKKVVKYHTTAHLLMQALRQVLGDHVTQKGSNITEERLRLDFSHPEKMTPEQIAEVEKIVNEKISEDLPVTCQEMSLNEAKKIGAMGVFENKYGDKVKVYSIGSADSAGSVFSREICGGPHIDKTGQLGKFKISKETSSSSGVRRIKAVLE